MIRIYTPFGYKNAGQRYKLLVLFDGQYYTSVVPTPTILDNMAAQRVISPFVAVLIDNINEESRLRELHCNDIFGEFLAKELTPRGPSQLSLSNGLLTLMRTGKIAS